MRYAVPSGRSGTSCWHWPVSGGSFTPSRLKEKPPSAVSEPPFPGPLRPVNVGPRAGESACPRRFFDDKRRVVRINLPSSRSTLPLTRGSRTVADLESESKYPKHRLLLR